MNLNGRGRFSWRRVVALALVVAVGAFLFWRLSIRRRYFLKRLGAALKRVEEGRRFNDGWDRRRDLMSLAARGIRGSGGVFAYWPELKDSDISAMASLGFLAFHTCPIPFHHSNTADISKCDHIIVREHRLAELLRTLRKIGMAERFVVTDREGDYVSLRRRGRE